MAKRSDEYWIEDRAQLRALASPVRQEILDAFQAEGPTSVREVARSLGRSPHSLYHHVRALLRVGLLVETERRMATRRIEALYATPGRLMRIAYDLRSKAFVTGMKRTSHALLRITARDFTRALERGAARVDGDDRNLWIGRIKGRLGTRELALLNRRFQEIFDLISARRPQQDSELCAVTIALVPSTGRHIREPLAAQRTPAVKRSASTSISSKPRKHR